MTLQKYTPAVMLKNADLVIAGICLVILSTLTFVSIFTRYFLHEPFMFLEETQKALLIWITMFSGCACFRYKQHVMIEIIVDMFSPAKQKIMKYFMVAVVTLVLAFLAIYGTRLCMMHFNADRVTNVLQFPLWIIYSAVPIGAIAMIYSCIKAEIFNKHAVIDSDIEHKE